MCIKGYISEKNPLAKLIEDPYAFDILNPDVDFEVELVEQNVESKFLLFKRKFNSSIGYVLVFHIDKVSIEKMHELYEIYKNYCGEYANYNFREIDLVIIANKVTEEVLEVVREYNEKYVHRRPITIVINKI